MTVYLINILLIFVLGVCLIYTKPSLQKKRWFCTLSSLNWILISGLRHLSIGSDTIKYANSFEQAGYTSWQEIFGAMYKVYIEGYTPSSSAENFLYKDPGYLLFQKITHIFTNDYQLYLIIIAVIFFALMGRFIYKNSEDPCFSYILFSMLFYSFYAITGHRQTLATALIVFVGYELIKERKFWRFLLVAILAFILHKSSLVFVPFYLLSYLKINGKYLLTWSAVVAAVFALGGRAILWFSNLLGYERTDVYEAPTYTFTAMICMVAIFVLIAFNEFKDNSPFKHMETNAMLLATMFALFTLLDQSMMRVQQYYSLFMMLSLPSALSVLKDKHKLFVKGIALAVLLFLFIRTGASYKFFWQ